jgi:hypothetical protein
MGTLRQEITALLRENELNAIDISQQLSIQESEVYDHLRHISKSLAAKGGTLRIQPYQCLTCGYAYKDRKRFKRPGRCPRCKGCHIRMATYSIHGVDDRED